MVSIFIAAEMTRIHVFAQRMLFFLSKVVTHTYAHTHVCFFCPSVCLSVLFVGFAIVDMPLIEVWGPATWALFHVLTSTLDPSAFTALGRPLFHQILSICKVLFCEECSGHATSFLSRATPAAYLTSPQHMIDFFYVFHNSVNHRKKKPLFYHPDMTKYRSMRAVEHVHRVVHMYAHARSTMRQLAESTVRRQTIHRFQQWFVAHARAFVAVSPPPALPVAADEEEEEEEKEEEKEVSVDIRAANAEVSSAEEVSVQDVSAIRD